MWCALDGVSAQGKARSSRPSHLIGGARHQLRITSCCPLHVALYYQYVAPTCCSSPCCPLRHQSLTSRNIPQFITSPLPRRWRIWDHYDINAPSMLSLLSWTITQISIQHTHTCQTTLPQSWTECYHLDSSMEEPINPLGSNIQTTTMDKKNVSNLVKMDCTGCFFSLPLKYKRNRNLVRG